jgi:uncharacterized protein (UPF0333 family)
MSRSFGFIALILTAGIVMYLYMKNTVAVSPGAGGKATPQATIDIVGVKNDLNAIAQAERRYWATNSKYVSIDDLRTNGDISMQSNARGSYQYSADYSDNAFRITATYSGEPIAGIPHSLNIDQNMEIREGP